MQPPNDENVPGSEQQNSVPVSPKPLEVIPVLPSGVPPQERVEQDVACKQCGYNLRTLPMAGRCPECNTAVRQSLIGYYLGHAPPEWVRRLSRGVLLLIVGISLSALAGVAIGGWAAAQAIWQSGLSGGRIPTFDLRELTLLGGLIGLPGSACEIIGLFWLTVRNPADPPGTAFSPARPWLRAGAALLAGATLLGWLPGALPNSLLPLTARGWLMAANQVVGGGTFALVTLLLLWHLGHLMARIPRPGLVRYAHIVWWGCLICGGLTIIGQTLSIGQTANSMLMLQGLSTMPAAPITVPGTTLPVATSSAPTSLPTPPGAFGPAPTVPIMLAQGLTGCGGCVYVGFMITSFVLLFYVRGALDNTAREAEGASLQLPDDTS